MKKWKAELRERLESARPGISKVALRRAFRREKLKRKRRALETVHPSCTAFTARRVLGDCAVCVMELRPDLNAHAWRRGWFNAITLLRAVGHALSNEDVHRSSYLKQTVDDAWSRWKSDFYSCQIFHGFIEEERNSILKEYRFANQRKVYPLTPGELEDRPAGQHLVVIAGQAATP